MRRKPSNYQSKDIREQWWALISRPFKKKSSFYFTPQRHGPWQRAAKSQIVSNMAATVWQQQVFALDAKYNAYRGSGQPNFREYSADFFFILWIFFTLRQDMVSTLLWRIYVEVMLTYFGHLKGFERKKTPLLWLNKYFCSFVGTQYIRRRSQLLRELTKTEVGFM